MANNILRAFRNKSYGGSLVNTKYSPLDNFDFAELRKEFCADLLKQRWNLLHNAGLLPQPLTLVMPSWQAAIDAEKRNRRPPLVVISTNRSGWILKAFESVKGASFENASDVSAIAGGIISPPIYTPNRIGNAGPRSVYIVVNISEYKTYKSSLADFAAQGVTVVGWSFRTPRASANRLCGFGASRFAAIEFCKTLQRWSKVWKYAWLFDDNVVALTSFPGYAAVEAAMDASDPEWVCAGFRGGTKAEPPSAAQTYAFSEIAGRRGHEKDYKLGKPAAKEETGVIQQASVWNISYLSENCLNFGPMFLESGEDVSLTHYLNHFDLPYAFYDGIGVYKEDAGADSSKGGNSIKTARTSLVAWMAAAEAREPTPALPEAQQPPPIKILPKVPPPKKGDPPVVEDTSLQTVANYVVNNVLPKALEPVPAVIPPDARPKVREDSLKKQNTAKCQAVELTILRAMEAGWLIDDEAWGSAFFINGDEFQEVLPLDKP